jgi:hypothetical protein
MSEGCCLFGGQIGLLGDLRPGCAVQSPQAQAQGATMNSSAPCIPPGLSKPFVPNPGPGRTAGIW